jgi:hypothetical protein
MNAYKPMRFKKTGNYNPSGLTALWHSDKCERWTATNLRCICAVGPKMQESLLGLINGLDGAWAGATVEMLDNGTFLVRHPSGAVARIHGLRAGVQS